MRQDVLQPSVRGQGPFVGVFAVAVGLLAAIVNGPAAAEPTREQIEADWLRQEAARSLSQASSVATQSDAAGGVDGDTSGGWGFHTSNDKEPWWHVDLGKAVPLDRVVIYNSHLPDRAARLKVLLSPDGKSWREAYARDGTVQGNPLAVPLKGAEGRFVRIQLPGPQWLHLNEVEVYGQADPKRNIALGCPADQSSTSEWSSAKLQAPVAVDIDWPIEKVLERGRQLVERRRRDGVPVEPMVRVLDEVAAKSRSLSPSPPSLLPASGARGDGLAKRDLYVQARWAVRKLVLADPRLNIDRLLFVRRYTYQSSHIYTDHFDGSGKLGGNLCTLSPVAPDGKLTELVPAMKDGLFGRFDLSYDAKKVVFAYKRPDKGYRIYEIGIDGSGLRQLTHDPPDEPEMIKRFQHGYDDMDPCYLANGKIMFVSTRSKRAVLCHNAFTATSLHVMDADGKSLRCISGNTVNEFAPCTMDDGRVIYTRWEYVDKGCGDVQSLWAMRPDGSAAAHVYKNNVALPATLIDARSIPGSHRLVAIGAPHMPLAVGPVVLLDIHITQITPAAMTNLTPEIGYPGHSGYPGGKFGYYKEPYPLGEDLFLVSYCAGPSHSDPSGYALYVLDGAGNRELLYRDPQVSAFQPIPLRPRRLPVSIPAVAVQPEPNAEEPATLFMADVYEGLTGIPRGAVKYLRVMEDLPKPWAASWQSPINGDSMGLQNPAVSLKGHFTIKKILGIVKVHEDGSAHFKAPPNRNLFFQVLDENYMELQRMRTFVNLMPGEQRSCIGCHETRKRTPALKLASAAAFNHPTQTPSPQPGDTGPRMVHYPSDVQPTLDKHCLRCHSGASPKGDLDLTGEPTTLFSRSYENLINKRLINNIDVDPRSAYIPAEPPLTFGSHRSKMIERIRSGPCKSDLSKEEFIRLVTWIDANAPYYGIYEGKKNLKWKGDPEFRPNPNQSARSQ